MKAGVGRGHQAGGQTVWTEHVLWGVGRCLQDQDICIDEHCQEGELGHSEWRLWEARDLETLGRAQSGGQAGEKGWVRTGNPEDLIAHVSIFARTLRFIAAGR